MYVEKIKYDHTQNVGMLFRDKELSGKTKTVKCSGCSAEITIPVEYSPGYFKFQGYHSDIVDEFYLCGVCDAKAGYRARVERQHEAASKPKRGSREDTSFGD